MITKRRRLLSGLLAIIMVAGMFTIFPLTTEAAAEQTSNTNLKYLTRALYGYSQAASAIKG